MLFAATTAWGQEVVIKRPPCEIVITAVGPYYHNTNPSADGTPATDQSRADVARVKAALEKALEQSEDMRTKVDDACKKQKNKMQILVFRDTTIVNYGHVEYGTIRLDLGDIDNIGDSLHGSQDAVDIVADAKLTRTLSHEIDHVRHTPKENHKDPQGEAAGLTRGPAVDDENNVIAQMDVPLHKRTFYGALFDGRGVSGYSVDTDGDGKVDKSVTWFTVKPTRVVRRGGGERNDYFSIGPNPFQTIAEIPCLGHTTGSCYPFRIATGSELVEIPPFGDRFAAPFKYFFNPLEPVTFGVQSGANLDRAVDTVNTLGGTVNYTFSTPFDLKLGLEYDLQVTAQPPADPAAQQAFHAGLENLQRLDVIGGYQMDFCREWLPDVKPAGRSPVAGITGEELESLPKSGRSISDILGQAPAVTFAGRAPPGSFLGSFDGAPDFADLFDLTGIGDSAGMRAADAPAEANVSGSIVPLLDNTSPMVKSFVTDAPPKSITIVFSEKVNFSDWSVLDAMGPNIVQVGGSGEFTLQGSSPFGDIAAANGWNQIAIPFGTSAPGGKQVATADPTAGANIDSALDDLSTAPVPHGHTPRGQEALTAGEKQFPDARDNWIQAFAGAFGGGSGLSDPTGQGSHISDASLKVATTGEANVAGEVKDELDAFTTNSGVAINEFLDASFKYRNTFSLIQSASTGLQSEVATWEAGKPGMEKADFAIALVQIIGGISKVGVKVAQWYQLRKAVPKASTAGAGQVAAKAEAQVATAASETGRVAGGTGASSQTAAHTFGTGPKGTQVVGQSATHVSGVGRAPVPRGGGGGQVASGSATRGSSATGGAAWLQGPAPQMVQRAVDVEAHIGPHLAKAASEAGVDAEAIIRGAGGFAQTALNRVMNAIAKSRGWHEIPIGLESAAQSILATVRRANAGDEIAIAALQSEGMAFQLKVLRNLAQSQPEFYKWLRKAASGFDDLNWDIGLLFNEDAIKLLKLVVDKGFDLKAIRALLGTADAGRRVTQGGVSLGAIVGFSASSLSAGNTLTRDGSAPGGATPQFGAGGSERDALASQAAAIYSSQYTSLGDVRQAMGGIWNRLDQGQGFAHIIGGEMWSWFMSPTTTYFNWWQDIGLSGEYLDLVTNYGQEFTDLTAHLTASIQSLRALQNAFNTAGITADSAVLGGGGIARLQNLLVEHDNTFAKATAKWQAAHVGEYLATRIRIMKGISSLEAMNAGFRKFLSLLPQLIQWLDQLRMNSATGGLRTAVQVFNPDIYVRLASVGLYLKVLASQGLLLDVSNPLVVKPCKEKWLKMSPAALKKAELALGPTAGENLDIPQCAWKKMSPEQKKAIQEGHRQRMAGLYEGLTK